MPAVLNALKYNHDLICADVVKIIMQYLVYAVTAIFRSQL